MIGFSRNVNMRLVGLELNVLVQQTIISKKMNIGENTIRQVVKVVKRSYFIV